MRRSIVTRLTVLSLGLSTLTGALVAPAAVSAQAKDVAELCRRLDEIGILAAEGLTRGECVNTLRGPASENANNFITGRCGQDFILELVGATNKGQCIKIFRELI